MTTLLNIADWIFIFVLGLPVLYLFVFALFSTRKSMDDYPQAKRRRKFVTLIPAYKSDAVIVRTAQAALRQELWDYVVLQEMSHGPISTPKRFFSSVERLCGQIRRNGATPL